MANLKVLGNPIPPAGKTLQSATLHAALQGEYADGTERYPKNHHAEWDATNNRWKPEGSADGTYWYLPSQVAGEPESPEIRFVETQFYTNGESQSRSWKQQVQGELPGYEWDYETPAPDTDYVPYGSADLPIIDAIAAGIPVDGTDIYTALSTLIADLAGAEREIWFSPGVYQLSTNLTIPSNIKPVALKGARFNIATNRTLTMPFPEAGNHKIFSGDGTVAFTGMGGAVNAAWFGLVNDGVTNNSPIFNKAIATAKTSSQSVTVPTGVFSYDSMLLIDHVSFEGSGDNTILRPSALVTNAALDVENGQTYYGYMKPIRIGNFRMLGDALHVDGVTGIRIGNGDPVANVKLHDIIILYFNGEDGIGVHFQDAVKISLEEVQTDFCGVGILCGDSNGAYPTTLYFNECRFSRSEREGILAHDLYQSTFINCIVEGNYGAGVRLQPIEEGRNTYGVTFEQCYFEGNWYNDPDRRNKYMVIVDGTTAGTVGASFIDCYWFTYDAPADIDDHPLALYLHHTTYTWLINPVLKNRPGAIKITGAASQLSIIYMTPHQSLETTIDNPDNALIQEWQSATNVWTSWTPQNLAENAVAPYIEATSGSSTFTLNPSPPAPNVFRYKKVGKTLTLEVSFDGAVTVNPTGGFKIRLPKINGVQLRGARVWIAHAIMLSVSGGFTSGYLLTDNAGYIYIHREAEDGQFPIGTGMGARFVVEFELM